MKGLTKVQATPARVPLALRDLSGALVSARSTHRGRRFRPTQTWRPAVIEVPQVALPEHEVRFILGWQRMTPKRREVLRLLQAAADRAALRWVKERADPGRTWETFEKAGPEFYQQVVQDPLP